MTAARSLAVRVLTLSCLAYPAWAATPPKPPLEATDVFEFETVGDPQISPDGTRVVYVRKFADRMTDRRYSNLWMVTVDGRDHRPVTTGRRSDSEPRFSPDGRRLAWISEVDDQQQIMVRYLDSGETLVVTRVESAPSGISWSPDGKSLAYVAIVKEPAPKVATLPSPPEGGKWADPPVVIDRLVYRFNGDGYLPYGFSHVFVVSAEGGTPRQITSGAFHHGRSGMGGAMSTAWAGNDTIVIAANRRKDWELEPEDGEIYEASVADGSLKALTDRRGPDVSPTVSADGRHVAYVGYDDRYQGYQVTRLYVVDRKGGAPRSITDGLDRDPEEPVWAHDGTGLYFHYDEEGETKIGFAGVDGKFRAVTTPVGGATSAYGGGATFSVARNGTLAFAQGSASRPGDVSVLPHGATSPRRLTAINDDLLDQRRIGAVEPFWFESSVDKRRVQAFVVKPPDFDPTKKYPLILEIHGGPFANYGPRFSLENQVLAGKGYVVLNVNPRGSTSYGEQFANLIHHAYPGDDFYDLNSGVDALVSKGYVDADNLFVGGGSGGGVLTAWMIGRTNRFRAAAAYYPVINWTSWALTADIPVLGVKYWFSGPPWEVPDEYNKRSLLSVVKNVKTPTLVMTGDEDWRTPMSESEQYYTALKLLGVESVLVRVPGEPHGISKRPSHHIAKMMNIRAWFDRYRSKEVQ